MENTVLIIAIGLQRDTDCGDVGAFAVEMTKENAIKVLTEQENCELLAEDGVLARLLDSYAVLMGYQSAVFVSAAELEDVEDE